jgi:hypothetical protein
MKKALVLMAVLAVVGAAAAERLVFSDGVNGVTIHATPLDGVSGPSRTTTAYSNMVLATNYASTGSDPLAYVGYDDYAGVTNVDTLQLESFKFVGGVTAVGGILYFDFYDALSTYVDGFGVQLSQAGNFIWTITINPLSPIYVPDDGFVGMAVGTGTTGKWFLNSAAPTVGTTGANPPNLNDPNTLLPMNYKFEINAVPEPASLLLALGGLLVWRRR